MSDVTLRGLVIYLKELSSLSDHIHAAVNIYSFFFSQDKKRAILLATRVSALHCMYARVRVAHDLQTFHNDASRGECTPSVYIYIYMYVCDMMIYLFVSAAACLPPSLRPGTEWPHRVITQRCTQRVGIPHTQDRIHDYM